MKNLSFDDVKDLNIENVIPFLKNLYLFEVEKELDNRQWSLITFSVEKMFALSVYASLNNPNEVRVHLYESMGRQDTKNSEYINDKWMMINPKLDERFVRLDWADAFKKDAVLNREAANVSVQTLIDMIKFVSRLSRIKVFE